jgi:ubiquinone/menaquinone biosynthesis C-methylase UbiE
MTDSPRPANPWVQGWDNEIAQRWVVIEEAMDRALQPFGDAALARARPRPGERVLDIGCGCGPSTVALAQAVGEGGHVLGVDIAAPVLERARARVAGLQQVELLQADAQSCLLPPDCDLVFSRFGVMFFGDFPAAFRNLASALRPGGRLVFACWRRFEDNPWFTISLAAVRQVLPDAAGPVEGPGPFAFADADRTRALLEGAGFGGVVFEPVDAPVNLGPDLPSAVHLAMNSGPAGRALPGTDPATRATVREKIAEALAPYLGSEGVSVPGRAWVVAAGR